MDLLKEDKLKVLKRCVKEANRLLKKLKNDDKQKKQEIEQDLAILIAGETSLKEDKVLNRERFDTLVMTINKYYYKKFLIVFILFFLLLLDLVILAWSRGEPLKPWLPTGGEDIENLKDVAKEEYVEIPGYQNLEVSKEQPFIQLKNLEDNSVYLQYNIMKGDETIYQSILVEPGNKCDKWNAYESLGKGIHKVKFFIKTFDVETQAECNSTTQKVKITVN